MIPHRFGRLLGAVLLLAPSLAFGQTALQQPCTDRTRGCTVQNVPAALDTLYANDVYLQGLIGTRFGQLGGAAFLNVGTAAGTVADGGALAAEISRAQAAEALKAPLASPAFTGTPTVPTAAPGTSNGQAASTAFVAAAITAGGGGGASYAVLYTAQTLTAGQQLQGRQNIGAIASGDSHVLGNGSTATTQAAGDNTTKVATDAFVTGALSSYAGTVASTYLTQSGAASTYAPLASPALTGTPTVPTASAGTNSTQAASTAYADRSATNAAALAVPNVATFNGLTIRPGSTVASQISVSASAAVLRGASAGLVVQNVAVTISTGTSGANGLDTGTLAASTWYAIHIIAKADGTKAGLLSLSATTPTLPSGYIYSARAGWARTNGSGTLVPIVQNGRSARFQVLSGQSASPYLSITSGSVGNPNTSPPTFVAVPVTNFAPSSAAEVKVQTWANNSSFNGVVVAPNPNYGGYSNIATTSPPTPSVTIASGFSVAEYFVQSLFIESANVYAASDTSSGAVCIGWEDNL